MFTVFHLGGALFSGAPERVGMPNPTHKQEFLCAFLEKRAINLQTAGLIPSRV